MTPALYTYNVRIKQGAEIVSTGPLAAVLPSCNEISISSKPFKTYELCEKSLSNLLASLSTAEAKVSAKNFVIVTKLNPLLQEKPLVDPEWDKNTVLRAYIADSTVLKEQSSLKYSMMGQILVSQEIIGLKKAPK